MSYNVGETDMVEAERLCETNDDCKGIHCGGKYVPKCISNTCVCVPPTVFAQKSVPSTNYGR